MEQGSRAAPAQPRHIIERPRLNALLDRASARVIVLFGPAGYGKTTLARQWLVGQGRPAVWYRATPASADTAALALGIARSIEQIASGAARRLDESLRTLTSPDDHASDLASMLVEDLHAWPEDAWVAIDDYHLISSSLSGESFIEFLAKESKLRLLLMTRTRPRWVSARALLYGDVLEIGHSALAMTHEEAEEVFRRAGEPRDPSGLVALAEGWPAVIGLAALTSGGLPPADEDVPAALHAYFADELFQMLSPRVQSGLCYLSIAPVISPGAARQLLRDDSDEVITAAYRAGFLTRDRDHIEIHPLLRQFLEAKRSSLNEDQVHKSAEALGHWYLAGDQIDEAFAVARTFSLESLMVSVIESALDRTLTEGRLTTLRSWLEALRDQDPGHPLAEAGYIEIVFREGKWSEACARAERLAEALPDTHSLKWRILYRAGQSAQLSDRANDALRLLTSAEKHARSSEQTRKLLWNRFVILAELEEHRKALETLNKYERLSDPDVEDRLRAIQGRLLLAARWGGVDKELRSLPDCDELLSLAARAQDPVARTGFLQTLCIATCLTARYELALELVERELQDAERARLDFVRPHALTARAVAYFGLRNFRKAIGVIEQVRQSAIREDDVHNEVNSVTILARILLAQNKAEQALRITDVTWPRQPSLGNYGDFLAVRALAFACTGAEAETREFIDASAAVTAHSDGRVVRAFARAVSALKQQHGDAHASALFALEEASETENFDAFVCSYRAYPRILDVLASDDRGASRPLKDVVVRLDRAYATRFGLLPVLESERADSLSKRETEVLELIQQGLSNRAIARALWISEATVKVHVRSIFRKLNVQSRTEAAVLAATRSP
jgi:DNA-binding CsgD family transcriptional regulator/tetratricopeptide (TPR) repeat protein